MTNLKKLRVSLTKHGAHKVAEIIKSFPAEEVLNNIAGGFRDIVINEAQTRKNLSISDDGNVPEIWNKARELGDREVENLVLIAIIFSHFTLIETMKVAATTPMRGKIIKGNVISGKAFSNIKCILGELGFAIEQTSEYVIYDLRRIFTESQIIPLIQQLLKLKLLQAEWDEDKDFLSECLYLKFNKVFSLPEKDFINWINKMEQPDIVESIILQNEDEEDLSFGFVSGHHIRTEESVYYVSSQEAKEHKSLHNIISNSLYQYLADQYGSNFIATEHPIGRKSIDIVREDNGNYIFYEIKTYGSIQSCIREAIGQLMEYAYWTNNERAHKLIIVSLNPSTSSSSIYMEHIREKFGIPIFYQQYDLQNNYFFDCI
jgi:hypothetical protein